MDRFLANDTVKSAQAPCLLGSRPGKMASVGQECVNFFRASWLAGSDGVSVSILRGWRLPFRSPEKLLFCRSGRRLKFAVEGQSHES